MTDFNLPPGCSTSDIPGCRPEDERYQQRVEDAQDEILTILINYSDMDSEDILDTLNVERNPRQKQWEREALAFGHECVVRQRLRQRAQDEGKYSEHYVNRREAEQEWIGRTQRGLDLQ